MKYLLLIPLVFLGCDERPHRTVASCKADGYKGIVSYEVLDSQSCSNGDKMGNCYLTIDGSMCTYDGRYVESVVYTEFKE